VAVVAEVSVDAEGRWKVDRIVCGVDCGTAVNPLGVRAQTEGGVVWAISAVSSEITLLRGRVQQSSFRDFPLLRMDAAPSVETHVVPSEEPPTGMGEAVNPVCLAAVVNALSAAAGRRLRRLPLTAEDFIRGGPPASPP
jgi:CO/xanthine dehydrogenase Mo-binding subunit